MSMPNRNVSMPAAASTSRLSSRLQQRRGRHVLPGNREFAAGDRIPKRGQVAVRAMREPAPVRAKTSFSSSFRARECSISSSRTSRLPRHGKAQSEGIGHLQRRRAGFSASGSRRTSMSAAPCATATDAASHCGGVAREIERLPTRCRAWRRSRAGRIQAPAAPGGTAPEARRSRRAGAGVFPMSIPSTFASIGSSRSRCPMRVRSCLPHGCLRFDGGAGEGPR